MAIVMELIGVSVKPIVGKALCAKDLVPDGFLDDESRRRISGQRWYHLDFGLGINNRLLSESEFYTPTTHDVGKVLSLECAGEVIFHTEPVIRFPLPPNPRQMIQVNNSRNAPSFTGPSFTVVTFNVLTDECARPEKYPNCPFFALSWKYRRENLLKEILQCDADIVCLQEVQVNHYYDFFYRELAELGYEGLFKGKERTWLAGPNDGCATFYKKNQFDLVKQWWIRLSRYHFDNIALNAILSLKNTSQRVCIANTHIHANPNNSEEKLGQVYCLLKEMEKYDVPRVICGDFNSLPGSAPHSLLTKGYAHPSNKKYLYYDSKQLAKRIHHTLPLASAYSSYFQCDVAQVDIEKKMNGETREPRFTNFVQNFKGTMNFKRTLDYIFYTTHNLKVVSLMELVDEEEVKDGALPSRTRSSDHIAIAAKFKLHRARNWRGHYP
jgi:CCR4-NOT transcription complex subunit 6